MLTHFNFFSCKQKQDGCDFSRNTIDMLTFGIGSKHTLKQSLANFVNRDELCIPCNANSYKSTKKFSHLSRYKSFCFNYIFYLFKC